MGTSHSGHLNKLCKEIWDWCIARNLWISAGHIAGKANVKADLESRQNQTITESMLNTTLFSQSLKILQYAPDIDLFTSRLNKQLPNYVAYRPDPESIAIDAFTINWAKLKFYAFPPFSVIEAVLKKIQEDKATGVCVLANWPTPAWFPKAMKMTVQEPVVLAASETLLHLPNHPTAPQKTDPACLPLIRTHLNNKEISTTAKISLWPLLNSPKYTSRDGKCFVNLGTLTNLTLVLKMELIFWHPFMRKAWDTAPLIPLGPPCLQYLTFQVGIHLVLIRL